MFVTDELFEWRSGLITSDFGFKMGKISDHLFSRPYTVRYDWRPFLSSTMAANSIRLDLFWVPHQDREEQSVFLLSIE
jgi:hypothetical protein